MEQREDKKVCPSEDGVCLSESTEKENRVCPSESTLRHQHEDQSKVQRKPEPESPTAESEAESGYSSLSFRRNRSKDFITDFKSGQPSAVRSPAGSDSRIYCAMVVEDLPGHVIQTSSRETLRSIEERSRELQELCRLMLKSEQQKALIRQMKEEQHCLYARLNKIKSQEIQLQDEQKAERELKLKHLEDQQHLNSGKKYSHKSKRKPPELTPSSPRINITDVFTKRPARLQRPPEFTPYSSYINILDHIYPTPAPLPRPPEFTPSSPRINITDVFTKRPARLRNNQK